MNYCSKCSCPYIERLQENLCPPCFDKAHNIIRVDPGDTVICDASCNREIEEDEEGGAMIGSWFFCKDCLKAVEDQSEVDTYCPIGMKTKEWILNIIR